MGSSAGPPESGHRWGLTDCIGGDQVRTLRASGSSYPGGRPAAADTQGPPDAKGPAMDAAGGPEQKACIRGVKCLQLDHCCA